MLEEITEQSPTLLLIGDAAVRDSLALLFRQHGYRVVTAPDARHGLIAFREHAPNVIVTDILILEQDGIDVVLRMHRERPDVKIIALSGGGRIVKLDYHSVVETLDADAVLEKGQGDRVLIETLSKLLMAAV